MKKRNVIMVSCIMASMLAVTACEKTNTETMAEPVTTIKEAPVTEPAAKPKESVSANNKTAEPTTEANAETAEPTEKPKSEPAAKTVTKPAYTYTDAESVMYAKSSVNVRDLPSTKGAKLGGLSQNQEITVTGTCNETGWYRIVYKESVGYVSNKYLVSEKVAAPAPKSNTAASNNTPATTTTPPAQTQGPITGTIVDGFDISTDEGMLAWLKSGHSSSEIVNADPGVTGAKQAIENIIDRPRAEAVFALINQERAANGQPELIWSEDLYDIAVQRCYERDSHASIRPGTGENYAGALFPDATSDEIHLGFQNSPSHRNNYMGNSYSYTYGAVAFMKVTNEVAVCYEVFQ